MIEIVIAGLLIIYMFVATGRIDTKLFFKESLPYLNFLKESDYDFLVHSRYGDSLDANELFEKRVRTTAIIAFGALVFVSLSFTVTNLIIAIILVVVIYKSSYIQLKNYYRKHLHEINILLPYYLKSLEILIQHYTVPVALGKSINSAPPIFKDGLKEMIATINAGNSTIDPYMDFAKKYPVRDSMRMMRLLYRLSLGSQERKQEQLIVFSKTISTLQAKARETKYNERLENMEKRTMAMLGVTGFGVLILLAFAIVQMFTI